MGGLFVILRSLRLVAGLLIAVLFSHPPAAAKDRAPLDFGVKSPLPLPSSLNAPTYEAQLFEFLNKRAYKSLGWLPDKRVRDTGPFINGKYYGTHPAVKIFYSPEIITWLLGGRKEAIPDGAMIIKEQYEPPATRYDGLDDDALFEHLSSWTVMVKDSAGSHDGWFWSNPAKNQQVVDNHQYPFDHPISGFGIYCVRCHASTKSGGATNEYTFASLRNVEGFPGEPLLFRIDDSWRKVTDHEEPVGAEVPEDEGNEGQITSKISLTSSASGAHPRCTDMQHPELCNAVLNPAFLTLFPQIGPQSRDSLLHFPPVTHDWAPRRALPHSAQQYFVTSNQCMSCHAGLLEPFGPVMFVPTSENAEYAAPGVHISPYGEWRWTPMGLAGRDPIFFAQLESEIALLQEDLGDDPIAAREHIDELVETCLNCHGAMGKHQYRLDHGPNAEHFGLSHVYSKSNDSLAKGEKDWHYGALARDGISCTVCHHMQPREQPAGDNRPYLEYFLETSITGNINLGNPNELYGPYEDKEISPYAMEHALGFKPKHSAYIQSSQMCGTCHVVNLPIVDRPLKANSPRNELIRAEQNPLFKKYSHHIEQATYLEWLNSEYENEFHPDNPQAKTCQNCHMSRDYHNEKLGVHLEKLETRIAAIQDDTYPDAENLAERGELNIRIREQGFARHNFRGLNAFLLEMFNQFDDVLGVRKYDFMTGSTEDIAHAMDDFVRQAQQDVAEVKVISQRVQGQQLEAQVRILNKVGHRFPSGVGFRRAFLEFLVVEDKDGKERIVWSSGRTNELGVLVDQHGKPLPTEFFAEDPESHEQCCQHHHEVITSPEQVQVYETLLHSTEHRYTTSFIHGADVTKDNRLLPRGWKHDGPDPALNGEFLHATYPGPRAINDPRYTDGSGSDEIIYRVTLPEDTNADKLTVRVTLFYQAIPPYFLQSLFETAPNGPATKRLHYLCSNMNLQGTPIEDWKLPIAKDSARVE